LKRPPQPEGPRPEDVGRAFHDACLAELEALKPGNVHRFGEGHRMRVADFEASARAAAPLIAEPGLGVGTRIRLAVEATMAAVGQNTNLGILLLSAPLAAASLDPAAGNLQSRLVRVLGRLSVADASEAYQGIRHAKPGGLGEAPRHDVSLEPEVTLLEAMRQAETRDRIAWNYTHAFADIFALGLPALEQARARWTERPWTVTSLYLAFLGSHPDSLIERKFGGAVARQVLEEAHAMAARLAASPKPEEMAPRLLDFDRSLKARGLNPGTSADLTVATLFADALQALETGR